MKTLLLTAVAVIGMASAVQAADVTGSVELEVAKASDGVYAMTPTLTLGFGTAIADGVNGTASISMEDNAISGYTLGVTVGKFGLSVGDQDDIFVEGYAADIFHRAPVIFSHCDLVVFTKWVGQTKSLFKVSKTLFGHFKDIFSIDIL